MKEFCSIVNSLSDSSQVIWPYINSCKQYNPHLAARVIYANSHNKFRIFITKNNYTANYHLMFRSKESMRTISKFGYKRLMKCYIWPCMKCCSLYNQHLVTLVTYLKFVILGNLTCQNHNVSSYT